MLKDAVELIMSLTSDIENEFAYKSYCDVSKLSPLLESTIIAFEKDYWIPSIDSALTMGLDPFIQSTNTCDRAMEKLDSLKLTIPSTELITKRILMPWLKRALLMPIQ